jgi:hypothetical protein
MKHTNYLRNHEPTKGFKNNNKKGKIHLTPKEEEKVKGQTTKRPFTKYQTKVLFSLCRYFVFLVLNDDQTNVRSKY